MDTTRLRYFHPSLEEIFQVGNQSHLIKCGSFAVKVHEQIQVASLSGLATSHRSEDSRIPGTVAEEGFLQLFLLRLDDLLDPKAPSRAYRVNLGSIPEERFAPRAALWIDSPWLPNETTTEAAREASGAHDVGHDLLNLMNVNKLTVQGQRFSVKSSQKLGSTRSSTHGLTRPQARITNFDEAIPFPMLTTCSAYYRLPTRSQAGRGSSSSNVATD